MSGFPEAMPAPGARAAFRKTLTVAEQAMFTGISGNLGAAYVDATRGGMVAFELVVAALASTCLARLGGPGRRVSRLDLRFLAPVPVGATVEASAEVLEVRGGTLRLRLRAVVDGRREGLAMEGEAEMLPLPAGG